MPFTVRQVNTNSTDPPGRLGRFLRDQCLSHFTRVLGQTDLNLRYGACLAAVAVRPASDRSTLVTPDGQLISLVYGCSRLYAGLDPDFNAVDNITEATKRTNAISASQRWEHAEQTAIRVAESLHFPFFELQGHCHLYVDFPPCNDCANWLTNVRTENWLVHTWSQSLDEQAQKQVSEAKKEWWTRWFNSEPWRTGG
jgi:deoxycytidylate deaminase